MNQADIEDAVTYAMCSVLFGIVVYFCGAIIVHSWKADQREKANPRTYAVTTPSGEVLSGMRIERGVNGWLLCRTEDGRRVFVGGSWSAVEELRAEKEQTK